MSTTLPAGQGGDPYPWERINAFNDAARNQPQANAWSSQQAAEPLARLFDLVSTNQIDGLHDLFSVLVRAVQVGKAQLAEDERRLEQMMDIHECEMTALSELGDQAAVDMMFAQQYQSRETLQGELAREHSRLNHQFATEFGRLIATLQAGADSKQDRKAQKKTLSDILGTVSSFSASSDDYSIDGLPVAAKSPSLRFSVGSLMKSEGVIQAVCVDRLLWPIVEGASDFSKWVHHLQALINADGSTILILPDDNMDAMINCCNLIDPLFARCKQNENLSLVLCSDFAGLHGYLKVKSIQDAFNQMHELDKVSRVIVNVDDWSSDVRSCIQDLRESLVHFSSHRFFTGEQIPEIFIAKVSEPGWRIQQKIEWCASARRAIVGVLLS